MEIKACGVLVYRDNSPREFLLMEHADRLDIPKGHLDPGETELECALRELFEETGIPAEAIELDGKFRFTLKYQVRSKRHGGKKGEKTLVVYLGRLVRDATIEVSEHEGYRWVTWAPPHKIQERTIDPLLEALAAHWAAQS